MRLVNMHGSGHSLIELTYVLTILVFFTTLSVGNLSYLDRLSVRSAAEKLVADISFVQQKALVTGMPQSIDLSSYQLPRSITVASTTFAASKITAAATGVLCAGSVYLTDDRCWTYAVTIPVGGAAPRVIQKQS